MPIISTVHFLLVITQSHIYLIPYIYIVPDSDHNKVIAVSEDFPRNNDQAAVRFNACDSQAHTHAHIFTHGHTYTNAFSILSYKKPRYLHFYPSVINLFQPTLSPSTRPSPSLH